MASKLIDLDGEIAEEYSVVKNLVVQRGCCKRAFIRGAFLAAGSVNNPEKSYHIEIVCAMQKKAKQIVANMTTKEKVGQLLLARIPLTNDLKTITKSDQVLIDLIEECGRNEENIL